MVEPASRIRGTRWVRGRLRGEPYAGLRFWIIQALIFSVTLTHSLLEVATRHGVLHGILPGFEDLPIQLYVLPIVLAAYWYGFAGALMAGLLALILSVPNMLLFHRTNFVWLGELLSSTVVLAVGLMVGLVAERAVKDRIAAERASHRLSIIQRVTAVLNQHDAVPELVQAFLDTLVSGDGVRAATFTVGAPTNGERLPTESLGLPRPGDVLSSGTAPLGSSRSQAPIDVLGIEIGLLTVHHDRHGGDAEWTDMTMHVARELSLAVERAAQREAIRIGLRGYARAITVAQEAERSRIARDLHDGPAQTLVVLERGLGRLAADDADGPHASAEIRDLRGLVHDTLQSIRETMWDLRPSLLDDLGLLPALQSLVDAGSTDTLPISLRSQGTARRLSDHTEVAAYRIAQEALANALAHSGCSHITVSLDFGQNEIRLTIADDGRGFDETEIDTAASFGIMGMRERADLVGGRLDIVTTDGAGTTVSFVVPG